LEQASTPTTFLKHPAGLYVLFLAELFERFAYYGSRSVIVAYMLMLSSEEKLGSYETFQLYGIFTAGVYFSAFFFGPFIDYIIGQKRAVWIGGFISVAGYFSLAIPTEWGFYLGLCLLIAGIGLYKPSITCMVGNLYGYKDMKREAGFVLYYIGINIGALVGVWGVGTMIGFDVTAPYAINDLHHVDWSNGFITAGCAMLLSMVIFFFGQRFLKNNGELFWKTPKAERNFAPLISWPSLTKTTLVLIVSAAATLFWVTFELSGGYLSIMGHEWVTSQNVFGIDKSWLMSTNAIMVIVFGIFLTYWWTIKAHRNNTKSSITKIGFSFFPLALSYGILLCAIYHTDELTSGKVPLDWFFGLYIINTLAEMFISPIALSLITRFAPRQIATTMMGYYFMISGAVIFGVNTFSEIDNSSAADKSVIISISVAVIVGLSILNLRKLISLLDIER
jgi:POT family proton-dependent oligopeptide transporter